MDDGEQKRTTWNAAAVSIPCVELCLEDVRELRRRVNEARFMANIVGKAAKMGKKNVLEWLKERHLLDAEGMQGACWGACNNGHAQVLDWLLSNGYMADQEFEVCGQDGAIHGHIPVAQDHGMTLNSDTFAYAAGNGHLPVLEWLREHDCPSDSWACMSAARKGRLSVLQWLRERSYPWNEKVIRWSEEEEHWDIVEGARANGCSEPPRYYL